MNDNYNNEIENTNEDVNEFTIINNKKFEEEDKNILKNNENYKNNPLFIENNEKLNIISTNNNCNININTENCITNNNDIKQDKINTDIINNNNNNNNSDNYNNKNKDKEKISMEKITYQLNELKNAKNEKKKLSNRNKVNYNSPNKIDSVIENDDYIDFSGKLSMKKDKKINKNNDINDNNINIIQNKKPVNYILSAVSTDNIRKTKTETIQRQFRKYLYKKGYYGNPDKRKIAIIYLLKNMILCNIILYIFN